jgi:hypothetical protein
LRPNPVPCGRREQSQPSCAGCVVRINSQG